ncbi:hypothetical protein [Rhizobium sp. 1399]|jgi:hypothetical protein|uniref:hypothetical protein n=1 Tax=Rhizobium sp. 1399 TaxID=2817758 RepID=UPI002857F3FB|nr:hypothetical protein [Rhizobium sp. 1399]MDR6667701.1 hypothetical protein [Rhizobium sp. 1399]
MPIIESDRILFERVWAAGAKVVRENRISALIDVARNTPTLEQYQDSRGQRMTDMIKVVQLGIAQLRGSEDLAQSDDAQTPTSPSRRFANSRN